MWYAGYVEVEEQDGSTAILSTLAVGQVCGNTMASTTTQSPSNRQWNFSVCRTLGHLTRGANQQFLSAEDAGAGEH